MELATAPAAAVSHAVPHPGEPVPVLALPTVGIFFGALAAWGLATWAAIGDLASPWATIPVHAAVTFVMFTVAHEATHYAISRTRWVNGLFGRLAAPFVAAWGSFPVFSYIHIEHHRHSNDEGSDPDTYASHGRWWQLPFRWASIDLWYTRFYASRWRSRSAAEVAETAAVAVLSAVGIAACAATGNLWTLAVAYVLPQRIGLLVLAWWFDWLPHHGLAETQRENRYRAARARVGMEWLFTPLMLSQNYHLVHHLHPSIPFYRYLAAWRRNEEAYLERDAAIATVFGHQLTSEEYRVWRELDSFSLARLRPVEVPEGSSAPRAVFARVPVAEVKRLTEDSVLITFDVPEALRDQFGFTHGQHLTVRTDLGGEGVRRNYSICSAATGGPLRIAVKRIPDGAFSTFAMQQLVAGDELELMTPTGRFGAELDPLAAKHYVAIAAGSGITPILSILATTLEVEAESRFTLIYGNRTRASTMFRDELDELELRYSDRLEILHVVSREPQSELLSTGRIDREKLEILLATTLPPDEIDEWFLCGPLGLTETARETLLEHGVHPERVRLELFYGYDAASSSSTARETIVPCVASFMLDGAEYIVGLEGDESILEAALRVRSDVPYACMGGACGTCRAKLVSGNLEMDHNFALGQDDLDRGYVLTCQSHPTTPQVRVDYDG
ncbi:MAG: fatty acid desaturase [Thermoleophilaceae bacterium]